MTIVLCGMPRCGKTSIGQALAHLYARCFIDTDKVLLDQFNQFKDIAAVYRHLGNDAFRNAEWKILTGLCAKRTGSIVALGGGTLTWPQSQCVVRHMATLVYLRVECIPGYRALRVRPLPVYLEGDASFTCYQTIFQQRTVIFERLADYIVDVQPQGCVWDNAVTVLSVLRRRSNGK